ncbi:hypothetical protein ACXY7D_11955 [Sphingomonas melonis]
MPTTTPYEISPAILEFTATIAPGPPEYVEVAETRDPLRCFQNCPDYVKDNDGQTVLGWAIWERDGAYLEAEHHAVVRRADGTLLDVTPHDGESHILFLADPSATFNGKIGRANHRFPIAAEAGEWKRLADINGERMRRVHMYGAAKMTVTQKNEAMRDGEKLMKVQQRLERDYPGKPIYRK